MDSRQLEFAQSSQHTADRVLASVPGIALCPSLIRRLSLQVYTCAEPDELRDAFVAHLRLGALSLRMANSTCWQATTKITSLPDLIDATPDPEDLLHLALMVSCVDLFRDFDTMIGENMVRQEFWNAVARAAHAARRLAELDGGKSGLTPRAACAAAFTHDMGHLALAASNPDAFRRAIRTNEQAPGTLLEAQLQEFGTCGPDVTARMLFHWRMPESLQSANESVHGGLPAQSPSSSLINAAVVLAAAASDGDSWRPSFTAGASILSEFDFEAIDALIEEIRSTTADW